MPISDATRDELRKIFEAPLKSTIQRRSVDEPWDEAAEREQRPFHYALVPATVWKGSKFERSFVTSLGSVWERAAVTLGGGIHGWSERGFVFRGEIHSSQLHTIQSILNELETRKRHPDWERELDEVLNADTGHTVPCEVTVDVAVGLSADDRSTHSYFEIKAPQPNSDQTKVSKEKMMKLSAMEHRPCAFYALPFNPYGTREAYAHPFPKRWFDLVSDAVVLIGDEFWNEVGGVGTWDEMIQIAVEVGATYRDQINNYLLAD